MCLVRLDGLRILTSDMSTVNLTVLPGRQTVTTTTSPSKQSIADLINHISQKDNHLWQALNSLQNQSNSIIASTTAWTTWNPQFIDDQNIPIANQISAYYMTTGSLLVIDISGQLVIGSASSAMQISMPVDVGDAEIKTCACYLDVADQDNGIVYVGIIRRTAIAIIKPESRSHTCNFTMGGAIAIL